MAAEKAVFFKVQPVLEKIEALHIAKQQAELSKRISQWNGFVKQYPFLQNMISDKLKQILLGGLAFVKTKTIQTVDELIAAAEAYFALFFGNGEANNTLLQTFGVNQTDLLNQTDAELQNTAAIFEQMRAAAQALIAQRAFLPQVADAQQRANIGVLLANADENIDFLEFFNANNNPPLMQILRQAIPLCRAHDADYPTRWNNEIKLRKDSLDTTQADIDLVRSWQTRLNQMMPLVGQTQNFLTNVWTTHPNALTSHIAELQAALIRANEKRADLNKKKEPEREDGKKRPNPNRLSNIPLTSQGQNEANAISPNDVIQGDIDDCPVISSLASLAANNPQSLLQMPDGRNRFTLTSAQGKLAVYNVIVFCRNPQTTVLEEQTVSVTAKFYTDRQGNPIYANNRGNTTELWAMLYEKALAQLRGGYDGLNFAEGTEIAAMLTGRESTQTKITTALTDADIIALLQQPRSITMIGSISTANQLGQANQFSVPLVDSHAYRFESINNNLINLNNPQGRNHISNMTIADLRIYFNTIICNG